MDKKNKSLIVGLTALVILVISVPSTYIFGDQAGAVLRWAGVVVGIVYLVMHQKNKKDQMKK